MTTDNQKSEETKKLIYEAQRGDTHACEKLVRDNMGLIWSIVRRFAGRGYEPDDLFQVGAIGLIKCISKFDLSYDVKFSTYAVPMILGEIRRFLRDDGMIKVSRPLKEIAAKARYVQEEIMHRTGQQPTVNEIAAALETNVDDLIMALDAGREIESLYATTSQNDNNPIYLIDKLNFCSDDNLTDKIALKELINELSDKERRVIVMRYFLDKTQSDVAQIIGVSQVQVSRIERRALLSLRAKLAD